MDNRLTFSGVKHIVSTLSLLDLSPFSVLYIFVCFVKPLPRKTFGKNTYGLNYPCKCIFDFPKDQRKTKQ